MYLSDSSAGSRKDTMAITQSSRNPERRFLEGTSTTFCKIMKPLAAGARFLVCLERDIFSVWQRLIVN